MRRRETSARARPVAWRLALAACLASGLHVGSAMAQTPAPLPPLPDSPSPPPGPAPSGTVQDVTILPPLPPPVEAAPPPPAPLYDAPTATPTPSATATATPTAPAPATPTEEVAPHGLSFGLRLDVGIPIGQVFGQPPVSKTSMVTSTANDLNHEFALVFPVTLDVGYRLTPHWYLGGYFAFGEGTPPSYCTGAPLHSGSCVQNDIRFGVDAKYLFSPSASVDPWIGAGLGWEIANQENDDYAGHAEGPEFFHLRAGLDFRLAPHLFGGPEAQFSFAAFTNAPAGQAIELHDWVTLGLSGHYDL